MNPFGQRPSYGPRPSPVIQRPPTGNGAARAKPSQTSRTIGQPNSYYPAQHIRMLERGAGLPQVSRNSEVPGFGELLNRSIRDGIGMGHENSLEWQRANLRD